MNVLCNLFLRRYLLGDIYQKHKRESEVTITLPHCSALNSIISEIFCTRVQESKQQAARHCIVIKVATKFTNIRHYVTNAAKEYSTIQHLVTKVAANEHYLSNKIRISAEHYQPYQLFELKHGPFLFPLYN